MKANELMIDDWVLCNSKPQKIVVIWGREVSLYDRDKLYGSIYSDKYNEKDIEPIPLTPEILEKNGFKLAEQRRNAKCFVLEEESYRISFIFFDTAPYNVDTLTKIEAELGTVMINKLLHRSITYVHQLQHAMRLWGIEKEIIL